MKPFALGSLGGGVYVVFFSSLGLPFQKLRLNFEVWNESGGN